MKAPFFVCTIWQTFRSLTLFKDGKFASPWNLLCEMKRRPKALTADPSAIIHFFFEEMQLVQDVSNQPSVCRNRNEGHDSHAWCRIFAWPTLQKKVFGSHAKGRRVNMEQSSERKRSTCFLFARPTDLRIVEEVKKCDDTSRKCNAKFT